MPTHLLNKYVNYLGEKMKSLRSIPYPALLLVISLLFFSITTAFLSGISYVGSSEDAGYALIGRLISEGKGFTTNVIGYYYTDYQSLLHPVDTSPPLYPLLVAGLFTAFGESVLLAKIPSLVSGLILLPFGVYLLGAELFSRKVGFIAALLTLFSPLTYPVAVHVEAESLFAALTIFAVYFFVRGLRNPSYFFLMGAVLGLSFLTKYSGLLLGIAAVVAYSILVFRKQARFSVLFPAGLLIGLFVAAPWLIRNFLIFGDPMYTLGRHLSAFNGLLPFTYLPSTGAEFTFVNAVREVGLLPLVAKIMTQLSRAFLSPLLPLFVFGLASLSFASFRKSILPFFVFLIILAFNTIYWLHAPSYYMGIAGIFMPFIVQFGSTNVPRWLKVNKEKYVRIFYFALTVLIIVLFFFAVSKYFVNLSVNGVGSQSVWPFADHPYEDRIRAADWVRDTLPADSGIFILSSINGFGYHSRHPTLILPIEGKTDTLLPIAAQYRVNYTQCGIAAVPLPDPRLDVIYDDGMTLCKINWSVTS